MKRPLLLSTLITAALLMGCVARPVKVQTLPVALAKKPTPTEAATTRPGPPATRVAAPDLLVQPAQCGAQPGATVDSGEALKDLELLRHILQRSYAGHEVLASRGVKWDLIFQRASRGIKAWPGPIPVEVLRALLLAAMQGVPDGHLALYTIGAGGRWRYGSPGKHRFAWTADVLFVLELDLSRDVAGLHELQAGQGGLVQA